MNNDFIENFTERTLADELKLVEHFRSIVENANDLIYTLSASGIITYVAPNLESLLGYTPAEIIGKPFDQFIHEAEFLECKKFIQDIIDTKGKKNGLEFRISHKNGDWIWYRANAAYMTDFNTGEPTFLGIASSISERKLAEEKLHESDELLSQFMLYSPVHTYVQEVTPTESVVLKASDSYQQMIGMSGVNMQGKSISELFPEELASKITKDNWNVVSGGNVLKVDEELDGRFYTTIKFPIIQKRRNLLAGFTIDITEQRKSEKMLRDMAQKLKDESEKLQDLNESLEELVLERTSELLESRSQLLQSQKMEAIGQLSGGLAHDFNNILSIINGYCSLIHWEVEHDEQLKGYVQKIMGASGRAAELTYSLLAFSRKQIMNPKKQNLNTIISNFGDLVKRIIGENIHFILNISQYHLSVNVDSGQIEQVLINLCNNARDAMPDGGDFTISSTLQKIDDAFIAEHNFGVHGDYAVISVTDTGVGMDETTRKKIFEPFFTTKKVGKGTGLGLAMVYGIVKQHKGFIYVVSQLGVGTSFKIMLPIDIVDTDLHSSQLIANSETFGGSEVILVAEDDADILGFMDKYLTNQGYSVILAVDGVDAVEKFKANADKIKLVIMDIVMPRKSGKAAYDEIKKIKPDTKALFSSGYSANFVKQRGELGELASFIAKPLQPEMLLKNVREILDSCQE